MALKILMYWQRWQFTNIFAQVIFVDFLSFIGRFLFDKLFVLCKHNSAHLLCNVFFGIYSSAKKPCLCELSFICFPFSFVSHCDMHWLLTFCLNLFSVLDAYVLWSVCIFFVWILFASYCACVGNVKLLVWKFSNMTAYDPKRQKSDQCLHYFSCCCGMFWIH